MIVSFVETMQGTVSDASGRAHAIDFDLKAEAASLRGFLKDGVTKVSGLLHAEPWATEVPLTGTLRISASERCIEYRLETTDHQLFLDGRKDVNPLTLVRSMTLMPVSLRDASGKTLATGEMRFDLKDLTPFLASWLPLKKQAQRLLDVRRRQVERRALAGA